MDKVNMYDLVYILRYFRDQYNIELQKGDITRALGITYGSRGRAMEILYRDHVYQNTKRRYQNE